MNCNHNIKSAISIFLFIYQLFAGQVTIIAHFVIFIKENNFSGK